MDDFVWLIVFIDLDLFDVFTIELNFEDADGFLDLRWLKVVEWSRLLGSLLAK